MSMKDTDIIIREVITSPQPHLMIFPQPLNLLASSHDRWFDPVPSLSYPGGNAAGTIEAVQIQATLPPPDPAAVAAAATAAAGVGGLACPPPRQDVGEVSNHHHQPQQFLFKVR